LRCGNNFGTIFIVFDDGTDTENGENELKAMVTVPMEKEAGVST
jgi:hypothetical protein